MNQSTLLSELVKLNESFTNRLKTDWLKELNQMNRFERDDSVIRFFSVIRLKWIDSVKRLAFPITTTAADLSAE